MEVSGVTFRRVPCLSGAGIDTRSSDSKPSRFIRVRPRNCYGVMKSGFCDNGHSHYYYAGPICGGVGKKDNNSSSSASASASASDALTSKKKLKLLKGLTKDLSKFSDIGFGLDSADALLHQVQGKLLSDAADVLMKQLQHLKAEEKELKRKRKQEKAKHKTMQMNRMIDCESSSSSSESSDSECEEVIDIELPEKTSTSCSSSSVGHNDSSSPVAGTSAKRIEVCLGNKCKKSGAPALLEEFERVVGVEGAVVGCKCMGKCRDGPNVRVMNCVNGSHAEGVDVSVRTPTNPLCIGVGLDDVGVIVANFFGDDQKGPGSSSGVLEKDLSVSDIVANRLTLR
uniref:Uncharacterized protein n=1 Tax=Fagus sylvatica TaxID=28930 RepID=A0A2N9EID0_FAGSY